MKTKTVQILLHNSKEYKALDKKLNGILSKSTEDLKEKDSTEVTQLSALIRIEKRKIISANDARKFGGEMYSEYRRSHDVIHFDVSTKFNDNINEGAELASYEFGKYKTTKAYKHNKLSTIEG